MFSPQTLAALAEGIFWFFVVVTFTGGVLAVGAHSLIRRVAGLALCFTGVAGLYYYLSSPFVAFMQMLIYVGALCVTITFAIIFHTPRKEWLCWRKPPTPGARPGGGALQCCWARRAAFW